VDVRCLWRLWCLLHSLVAVRWCGGRKGSSRMRVKDLSACQSACEYLCGYVFGLSRATPHVGLCIHLLTGPGLKRAPACLGRNGRGEDWQLLELYTMCMRHHQLVLGSVWVWVVSRLGLHVPVHTMYASGSFEAACSPVPVLIQLACSFCSAGVMQPQHVEWLLNQLATRAACH
jgi:hypothetical protein